MKKHGKTVKKTIEIIGAAEEEEERPSRDVEIDPEDSLMEEVAREFADGDRAIKLYRYPPGDQGGRPRYLGEVIREDFNEPFVANRYGGGRYFGRWRKKDGTYMRFPFEIEGDPLPIKRDLGEVEQTSEYVPAVFPTPSESGGGTLTTVDVLRIMSETRREAREEMRMMLELMRPASQPPAATEQVFSLVEKIVPMINSGGGGETNPWMFALSQLKEPLMKIVDTVHAAVNRPGLTVPANAPGVVQRSPESPKAAATVQPGAMEQAQDGDNMIQTAIKSYLPILLKAAQAGADTGLYADLIVDQVPAFLYPKLQAWLLKPGCLDELAKVEPALYQQQAWWESLRIGILEGLGVPVNGGPVQSSENPNATTVNPASSAPSSGVSA